MSGLLDVLTWEKLRTSTWSCWITSDRSSFRTSRPMRVGKQRTRNFMTGSSAEKKWIGCDWLGCCDTWQDRKGLHSFLTMESRAFKIKKQPLDLLSFDELGRWSTDRIFQRSINAPIKTHNVKLIVTFKQSSQVKKLAKKLKLGKHLSS